MKKLIFLCLGILAISNSSNAQTELYNLKSQNLNKKVAKTIDHSYTYHERSGGFVKTGVTINTYNDDGNLSQSFFQWNSTYNGDTSTTETLYNYDTKGRMISTQDISAKKSSYSYYNKYTYDNDGNLTKKEAIYVNGNTYTNKYYYDKKDRLIRAEELDISGKLNARENYSYSGNKKTKTRKSYDTKTGNVIGTYTTYYKKDISTRFVSKSKYSNSDVSYNYDKYDNLISDNNKNTPTSKTTYSYEYDNKDNWIKKYYNYGKTTNNFYFREIIFTNGNVTGSVDFDKNYIKKNGDFANVNVVPIVKYSTTKDNNTVTTSDPKMPIFKSKNFIFNYVNLDKKISAVNGEVIVSVIDNDRMSKDSTVKISYALGGKTYTDTYKVISFSSLVDYNYWSLKSTTKTTTIAFSINHEKKFIESRDLYLAGMLNITFNDQNTGFYLE